MESYGQQFCDVQLLLCHSSTLSINVHNCYVSSQLAEARAGADSNHMSDADIGNPVGELQESTQKKLWPPPIYEFAAEQGPPHAREFVCTVTLWNLRAQGKYVRQACGVVVRSQHMVTFKSRCHCTLECLINVPVRVFISRKMPPYHSLIQRPVHQSFGLVKCTVGLVGLANKLCIW